MGQMRSSLIRAPAWNARWVASAPRALRWSSRAQQALRAERRAWAARRSASRALQASGARPASTSRVAAAPGPTPLVPTTWAPACHAPTTQLEALLRKFRFLLRCTTTSRAALRAAAPLARRLSTTKKLSGAELDAAINEMNAEMDLVLFEDAMKHVARIVSQPRGGLG